MLGLTKSPWLIAVTAWCLVSPLAQAAEPLGMVTGPKAGTYIAIGRDIAEVGKKIGINIDVKSSDGSIDNIRRINSKENAAFGIVQSDVLGFMSRSHNPETIKTAQKLRMILPLYHEEVHLLARKDINNFNDLEGKKVIVGEDGSGHMLTAINLFAMTGTTPAKLIKKPAPEGIVELLDGTADAIIYVGGKPVKLFQNLDSLKDQDSGKYERFLSEVHFVPMQEPRMLEEYQVATITPQDYGFVQEEVPTIAVTAVLVTYDFSSGANNSKSRCSRIRTLAEGLRDHQEELIEHGHPKWKEVKLDQALPIWKQDSCAWSIAGNDKGKGKQTNSKIDNALARVNPKKPAEKPAPVKKSSAKTEKSKPAKAEKTEAKSETKKTGTLTLPKGDELIPAR